MWKHSFQHRRFKISRFFTLGLIFLLSLCIWVVQKNDVNSTGIQSELLGRFFYPNRKESIFECEIELDLAKQVPGLCDGGLGCFLTDANENQLGEVSYAANGMNVLLSDKITYNRTPPDVRNYHCRGSKHFNVTSLPTATVIIIFFEEPYSALLRTIHSVINTAPSILLKEIILVDDFSSSPDLKGKLSHYVKTRLPDKVKLLRLEKQ